MCKKLLILIFVLACAPAQAVLKIQNWTLDNGARVFFVESPSIPILDVSIEFDAGSRRDPADKSGVAALANAMLARGVREASLPGGGMEPALSEAEISNAFADIAAQRSGGAGRDRAGATLRTLSSQEERTRAVELLSRVLAHPSFPENLLERDKARTIAAIKESLTQPDEIAHRAFWRTLYQSHPYAREATVESVQAITRDDLVAFHAAHYVANRAVIAMIGAVSREEADAIARQLTARLPQGAPLPELPAPPAPGAREENIPHPASQSHILLGAPALKRGDPDYFPLTVGNYVLGGGGFVSRLTHEVREKRGLAYSVYSYFNPLEQEGPFQIGLQTQKQQTGQALEVVRDTLDRYLREGPSAAELKAAKDNLIGGFALRIDNNRKILDNIAVIGFYRLPLDYLDTWTDRVTKVGIADIKAAFQRKIPAGSLATIVVGAEK